MLKCRIAGCNEPRLTIKGANPRYCWRHQKRGKRRKKLDEVEDAFKEALRKIKYGEVRDD